MSGLDELYILLVRGNPFVAVNIADPLGAIKGVRDFKAEWKNNGRVESLLG